MIATNDNATHNNSLSSPLTNTKKSAQKEKSSDRRNYFSLYNIDNNNYSGNTIDKTSLPPSAIYFLRTSYSYSWFDKQPIHSLRIKSNKFARVRDREIKDFFNITIININSSVDWKNWHGSATVMRALSLSLSATTFFPHSSSTLSSSISIA